MNILLGYSILFNIEFRHYDVFTNLKEVDICPVKFITRSINFILETNFCNFKAITFKNPTDGCSFFRIAITMITHQNAIVSTPFDESIRVTKYIVFMLSPRYDDNRVSKF